MNAALRLSRATLRNIHENLFWAFFYNVIGIPLAAGVWYPLFGWELNPMFGAAAMSLSSFCVVTNALRLNLFRLRDGSKDRPVTPAAEEDFRRAIGDIQEQIRQEGKTMTRTIGINGMMCAHCEARMKKALEELEGVQSAACSHETNSAVLELSAEVSEDALRKAVTDAGYEYVG